MITPEGKEVSLEEVQAELLRVYESLLETGLDDQIMRWVTNELQQGTRGNFIASAICQMSASMISALAIYVLKPDQYDQAIKHTTQDFVTYLNGFFDEHRERPQH